MLNLTALARAEGIRRREITFRPVLPAPGLATDLAAIYAPAWRIWSEAIDTILAGYDPAPLPTGDTLTLDSPAQIETAISAVAADFMTRLVTSITPALRRWVVRAEQIHRSRWSSAVNAGVGIDLSTILTSLPVEETLETFIARNVALVRNISEQAQGRIADAIFRGYQNRTPVRDVAKELREAVGLGRKRAQRIASHQNSVLSATLDSERQAEAGIDKIRWRASGKLHPRPHHVARNGKIYFLKTGKAVEGDETIPPEDRAGRPPACGCREQAYIDLLGEIERDFT